MDDNYEFDNNIIYTIYTSSMSSRTRKICHFFNLALPPRKPGKGLFYNSVVYRKEEDFCIGKPMTSIMVDYYSSGASCSNVG